MRFTLAVHGSPYASNSNTHALGFTDAALAAGHDIDQVFFYHDGVYTAVDTRVVPQDEANVTQRWQRLAQTHDFPLHVCIANAIKRGVLDTAENDRYEQSGSNLAEGFELVGLGQLIAGISESDRYVEF